MIACVAANGRHFRPELLIIPGQTSGHTKAEFLSR
jgi:hypothetical protein